MKNLNLLEDLLDKYLQRKLTIDESRQFNDLITDDQNEEAFKEIIYKRIAEFHEGNSVYDSSVDFDEVYTNIVSKLKTKHVIIRKHSLSKIIIYVSSAAAILAGVFLLGKVFPFSPSENKVLSQPAYTEINSPYGSKAEIKLPDGTSVILNAGSSLKYRNDFNISNRDLILKGEAYFKVAKNTEIPMIVSAGSINVIAVGTEFNIKAYPDENTIETTLINGKVEILNSSSDGREKEELIDLNPNQKAIFYKDADRYMLAKTDEEVVKPDNIKTHFENVLISPKADVEKTVAWTKGKLIFRGESLGNLSIDLQRKYDVKLVFVDENLKKYRFTGVLMDETLEQVLNVIKLTASINYSLEGKTVYLFTDVRQLEKFME